MLIQYGLILVTVADRGRQQGGWTGDLPQVHHPKGEYGVYSIVYIVHIE